MKVQPADKGFMLLTAALASHRPVVDTFTVQGHRPMSAGHVGTTNRPMYKVPAGQRSGRKAVVGGLVRDAQVGLRRGMAMAVLEAVGGWYALVPVMTRRGRRFNFDAKYAGDAISVRSWVAPGVRVAAVVLNDRMGMSVVEPIYRRRRRQK